MATNIHYLNPDRLFKSPAFSQVVTTQGEGKNIYIGGQNAVNANGELIGKGDLTAQTEQVMRNIQTALAACGATFDHVVKLTIYLVQGQDARQGFQASQPFMSTASHPPAITALFVSALGHPDFLLEVEATAFVSKS